MRPQDSATHDTVLQTEREKRHRRYKWEKAERDKQHQGQETEGVITENSDDSVRPGQLGEKKEKKKNVGSGIITCYAAGCADAKLAWT